MSTLRLQRHVLALLLALPGASPSAQAAAAPARPNIVFILADDLGWTDLGCYGSRYYQTPHVDRLAREGMRFAAGYTAGPNCQPTRAALMTGQYGPRTGIYTVGDTNRFDWSMRPLVPVANVTQLAPRQVTFAEILKPAGYTTGLFGKWHLGGDAAHHPLAQGFDEALVTEGRHFDFETNPRSEVPAGAYLADFLTERALDFIDRHQAGPFLLCLHHFAVHSPHQARPDKQAALAGRPVSDGHRSPVYAAMIASLDQSVGRVLDHLDELGVADHTLVVFTSDNGGVGGYVEAGVKTREGITDNAPLRGGKGMLYEGGVRVPFVFRWPGRIAGGTLSDEPIHSVDILPTFAALAGAPLPGGQAVDGLDLVPLLTGALPQLDRPALFWHFPGYLGSGRDIWRTTPVGAVRVGDFKLLEFFEDGRLELYDVRQDIGQRHNLVEGRPELTRDLRARLVAWREAVRAPMPVRKGGSEPGGASP